MAGYVVFMFFLLMIHFLYKDFLENKNRKVKPKIQEVIQETIGGWTEEMWTKYCDDGTCGMGWQSKRDYFNNK